MPIDRSEQDEELSLSQLLSALRLLYSRFSSTLGGEPTCRYSPVTSIWRRGSDSESLSRLSRPTRRIFFSFLLLNPPPSCKVLECFWFLFFPQKGSALNRKSNN